ncbi:hypothetical protein [Hyphomicrobium sp.]|uniref:hypothetical protein n=1 Tax=Hyphomicrobium sp. TaxID=82 RepID=UPI0025C06134|nr:hypothetical protein [Hyphomicrobium sp.]MCC7254031.1 hypothetical protein [Hyphomicrobium sp.]
MFRSVTPQEFQNAIADGPASPAFHEQFLRFVSFEDLMDVEAVVYDGDLRVSGSFRAPGLCTLIVGNLDVEDVVDLQSHFDQGGLFIVLGNVTCRHFISEYGLTGFIDGDLVAQDSIVADFSDSGLSVIGTLRTRLFIGCDIGAYVGAGAAMDYGVGYCTPIGDDVAPVIRPLHDESATARIVVPPANTEGYMFNGEQFVDLIRAGQPIFK